MEFRVLGPLRVCDDGRDVPLGGQKQRLILAMLLSRRGGVVSADALVDALWGDDLPADPRKSLYSYVSHLRSGVGDRIERIGDGYRLSMDADWFDAAHFEELIARSRETEDPRLTAELIGEALGLWTGRPFGDLTNDLALAADVNGLDELRLTALEDRIEADLATGHHVQLVGELDALTREYPLRERFCAQHMLALYRSGRQAEALRSCSRARELLLEELGIDPSPELQELEEQILRQDPVLEVDLQPRVESRAFLFTDLEGSTLLWELHPRTMPTAVEAHDRILGDSVRAAGGDIFKTSGDGICATFSTAAQAVDAATLAQEALASHDWGEMGELACRMAVNVGEVDARGGDYFGPTLNRCARLLAAAHGGQVLLTFGAQEELASSGADGWEVKALGEYRFKGLGRPQQVFQLLLPNRPNEFPPLRIDRLPPPLPGAAFGRIVRGYELREQIGGGDFGIVYRAYQPSVGREVAVKVVRPEFVDQPAFVRRFEIEAQIVARLEHPNIVPLFDYWRDPDGAYLVMRWLRGGSLRKALDRGPFNTESAVRLLDQICAALSYAHRQGVAHRDLKPSNVLLDDEGTAYLSDFGIAGRLIDASELGRPLATSPAYVPPEELRGEPLAATSDLYGLGLLTFELLSGRRPPMDEPLPPITAARSDLSPDLDEVIRRATADSPTARHESVEEFLREVHQVVGVEPTIPEEPPLSSVRNPFKGLHPFLEVDSQDFFGRDRLVDELVDLVDRHRLVAVVGPSGSGKSSVVRAGLLPALRAGRLPGSRTWLAVEAYPGSHPFEELEAALTRVATESAGNLLPLLQADELGMVRAFKRLLPDDGSELVLVLDQFEELFTLTPDEPTRLRYLDSLANLVQDARSRVRVVLTLRADFFDAPLRYERFGPLTREGLVTVLPLTRNELEDAITKPVAGVGVRLETGLSNVIIGDVQEQPGTLPLVQYSLTELFSSRHSDLLSIDGYRQTGGVLGALGRRAEDIFEGLGVDGREACRQVFLRLVNVRDDAEDTRRRVPRRELEGLSVDRAALDEVIGRFGDHRLLSFDRDPIARSPTVEIAHEALISNWDRLQGWVTERREDLLLHARLATAVREWRESERGSSYLLGGGRLEQFESWARSTDLLLSEDERTLLGASRANLDAIKAGRRRRRWMLMGVLALAAVVATILAVVAVTQRNRAETEERQAWARKLAADSTANLTVDPERSVLLAMEAVAATRSVDGTVLKEAKDALHRAVGETRLLLTVDLSGAERSPGHAELGPNDTLVVGGEFVTVFDSKSGEQILQFPMEGGVSSVQVSPDGARLAVGTCSGVLSIRDLATGVEVRSLVGHRACIGELDFSEDGTILASASMDGTFGIWDPATGEGETYGSYPNGIAAISLDTEATAAAVAPVWDSPFVWDLAAGEISTDLPWLGMRNAGIAFLGDSGRLVTGTGDGSFTIWDAVAGEEILTQQAHGALLSWLDVSPDGSFLATGGDDGLVKVWQLGDRRAEAIVTLAGHQATIGSVAFDDSTERVVSLGGDGTARVWDVTLAGSREIATLPGPDLGGGGALAFNSDGTAIAAPIGGGESAIWDPSSGEKLMTLPAHGWATFAVAFSPDDGFVATGGSDGTAAIVDARTGQTIQVLDHWALRGPDLPVEAVWVTSVDFSPDGRLLATADYHDPDLWRNGTVRLWDVNSGGLLREFATDEMFGFYAAGFGPDGRYLAALHGNGTVVVWDLESKTPPVEFTSSPAAFVFPGSVPISPDGGKIVLLDNATARIVELAGGGDAVSLSGHGAAINAAAFHPTGAQVATVSNDGTVRVWDASTGEELLKLVHRGDAADVTFDPTGRYLASLGFDGIRVWALDLDELIEIARNRLTRGFSDEECQTYLLLKGCPERE